MRDVLAIGSHPDDIELGCGGTLLAHVAAGHRVTMLVMTGGENGPVGADRNASRRREQEHAAEILGADLRWGGLRDCAVTADATAIGVIEQAIQETGAELVRLLLEGVGGVPEMNQGDAIHPNEAGQRKVAENVWAVLEPVLRQRAAR